MNTVPVKKLNVLRENKLEQVYEILLSCRPPYKEMDYFLDLARRRGSFEAAPDRGRRVIILGTGVPEELLHGAGAVPYWILGGSQTLSALADDSVPRDTDPVSRAMLGCLQRSMENFPKNTLILIPLINDSSRKLAYILKEKGYQVHTVYIPPTKGQVSDQELIRQGESLAGALSGYTGKRITRRRLLAAQAKVAEARRQIRHFIKLTNKKPELLPGIWRMFLLHSYYFTGDLEEWTFQLNMLNQKLTANSAASNAASSAQNSAAGSAKNSTQKTGSVLLLGSPIYFPNYKIPSLMQDIRFDSVVHLDYTTEKFLGSYHVDQGLTLENLMKTFYKKDCSSAYAENNALFDSVSKLLAKNRIDGVVYHVLKGQIEYDFELERLEEIFSSHSIPICRLETDYNYQDIEQLRIRLEAFGEVLEQRRFRKEAVAV